MKQFLVFLSIYFAMAGVKAQDLSKYEKKEFIKGADTLRYRILYPENFDATKKYPLILVLHGAGERGSDNEKQLVHGAKLFLNEQVRQKYPAVVVFPQCTADSYWSNVSIKKDSGANKRVFEFSDGGKPTAAMSKLLKFVNVLTKEPFLDQDRLYIGGLSMGGMGTFELLWRKPGKFLAAFPICGGGSTEKVKKYANKTDLWVFHGDEDAVVDPENSKIMVNALKENGANVKFTLYPGVNHNSWDNAFAEPDLLSWLFKHSK